MPTVTGIISTEDGSPVVGNLVRAFDQDMRSEQLLGEAITSDGGRYVIRYTRELFLRTEKKSADIIVHPLDNEIQFCWQAQLALRNLHPIT